MNADTGVRVRIAPSPTGYLHVGNVRSALFNWLFARRHGGAFLIRIDDTDVARSDERYTDDIVAGFRWLGLDWDEGVEVGGPYGSYRQSDRFDRYREAADRLISLGRAYHDFRTPQELEGLRAKARSEKKPPGYYIRRPSDRDLQEAADRLERGETAVVRFSSPGEAVEFEDLVRGRVRFEPDVIDDFVILRSDGSPTYHLASTIDDIDYLISHVARGEDLLSSTPKHILITEALGHHRPRYAHLPLLFGPDGRKLSKRHGDTSLKAYREAGYLPDAVFNYMSLLGWSLAADEEIFTRQQAVEAFDLVDVQKSPAVFDTEKLLWMNGLYIRSMGRSEFFRTAKPLIDEDLGRPLTDVEQDRLHLMAPLIQERAKLTPDIADAARFLFKDVEYDPKAWRKVMRADSALALEAARSALEALEDWTTEAVETSLRGLLKELGLSARKVFQPIRVAISGSNISPPLFESVAALPRQVVLERLAFALERLSA